MGQKAVKGEPMPGSVADRAIALLKQRGVAMRTSEIAEALATDPHNVPTYLARYVDAGVLVACDVLNVATGRKMKEYRISASGDARAAIAAAQQPRTAVVEPGRTAQSKAERAANSRKRQAEKGREAGGGRREETQARPCADEVKAAQAAVDAALSAEALAAELEPDTAPSECAPPAQGEVCGRREHLGTVVVRGFSPPVGARDEPVDDASEVAAEYPVFSVSSDSVFTIKDFHGMVELPRAQAARFCDFFEVMRDVLDSLQEPSQRQGGS